jgi:hypothetical protein
MYLLLLAAALQAPVAIDPGQHAPPARHDARGLLPVNADFFALAAGTGGDFYFWGPGEFARSNLRLPLGDEEVVLAYGRFDAPRRSVAIPVESGARELTVFAGAQRKDRAVLVRPDGAIVADGSADADLQTFRHMTLATVRNPIAGTWRLEVDGVGMYSISAHVRPAASPDAPAIGDFAFVEMRGRPGHEGWFPVEREPRAGETVECEVEVRGRATDVQVATVTGDGRPLGVLPMAEPDDRPGTWFGRCTVPDRPFRVVVTGRDAHGQPFRRIERGLRTPATSAKSPR